MREKIKDFSKKYLVGFIIGFISTSVVVVLAETYFPSNNVTYDNSVSGLSSTNVQGAIDELYGVCFPPSAGEQIIEDAGLEKDSYEDRYFFTGADVNNYITFNDETAGWRIISIEADGSIKIMKDTTNEGADWSNDMNDDWNNADLNTYLNETYFNKLSSTAQNQIAVHNWSVGKITRENDNLQEQINDENSDKWQGKIALPTVSEFLRTNSNSDCLTISKYNDNCNGYVSNICTNTTWFNDFRGQWTLTKDNAVTFYTFYISYGIEVETISMFIHPTLYLKSDVKITGGDGSQSNPYTIE